MSSTEQPAVNQDAAFLRELLAKVEEGKVTDVMVVCTGPSGKSLIAGPGLDKQIDALEATHSLTGHEGSAMSAMQTAKVRADQLSHGALASLKSHLRKH